MAFENSVKVPIQEGRHWLSHIEITRDGDEVVLNIVKTSGFSEGKARISDVAFNDAADLILTRSAMEKAI